MFGDPSCGATDSFGDPSCGATVAFGNPSSGATDAFGDPRFGATDAFSDPTITSFSELLAFWKLYMKNLCFEPNYYCSARQDL